MIVIGEGNDNSYVYFNDIDIVKIYLSHVYLEKGINYFPVVTVDNYGVKTFWELEKEDFCVNDEEHYFWEKRDRYNVIECKELSPFRLSKDLNENPSENIDLNLLNPHQGDDLDLHVKTYLKIRMQEIDYPHNNIIKYATVYTIWEKARTIEEDTF